MVLRRWGVETNDWFIITELINKDNLAIVKVNLPLVGNSVVKPNILIIKERDPYRRTF